MRKGNPLERFSYPIPTLMMDLYNLYLYPAEPGREDSDEGIEHRLPKYIRPDSDGEEYSDDEELRELNDRGREKKRGSLYRGMVELEFAVGAIKRPF